MGAICEKESNGGLLDGPCCFLTHIRDSASPGEYSDYKRAKFSANEKRKLRRERALGLYLENVAANCHGLPHTKRDVGLLGGHTVSGMSVVDYRRKAEAFVPSDARIISTSAPCTKKIPAVSMGSKVGGAGCLTNAFISAVTDDNQSITKPRSSMIVILRQICQLGASGYTSQITASRQLDLHKQSSLFTIQDGRGTCRALLIGIDTQSTTKTTFENCCKNTMKMKNFVMKAENFFEDNIQVMLSNADEREESVSFPSRNNILAAFERLVAESTDGDSVFVYFCGQSGRNEGEEKGVVVNEFIAPVDFDSTGVIPDTTIFATLIGPMSKGVQLTCFFDCDHSVVHLPYIHEGCATSSKERDTAPMSINENFSFLRDLEALKQTCATNSDFKSSETAMESVFCAARKNLAAKKLLFS